VPAGRVREDGSGRPEPGAGHRPDAPPAETIIRSAGTRPEWGASRRNRFPDQRTPLAIDRAELDRAAGRVRAPRLERQLRDAARAFEDGRADEVLPRLRAVVGEVPAYPAARELYGLALYSVGRWADALRELDAFATLTGSAEQHPVMADCNRALRRWDEVERLWEELRSASPSAELVTEGRIVAAGALADQDRLPDAIGLLAKGFDPPRRPRWFHLRRMYALADLYERAGELARSRELFRRVAAADPDFADVVDRVRSLG
jgi:tetratricopeptide (TPR) repeat protein